jgi:Protein of unknown function (DUF2490)
MLKISHKFPSLLIALFISAKGLYAQKTVRMEAHTWVGLFNQTRFSNKWGTWLDIHYRRKDNFIEVPGQFIFRSGLTYYLANDLRLTAGYAYVHHFPGDNHKNIAQPEHRPWQQLQWFFRPQKLRLTQRLRVEQRYRRNILNDNELGDGYNFNGRLGFNSTIFLPLTKKKFAPGGLQLVLNNEIFINFGNRIVYNIFDQHRFFAGLVWQTNTHGQLQFGYMNLYQQQASGNAFRNQHTIRIFYFQNFDLREGAH